MSLSVRAISAEQHEAWIARQSSVSFLQVPQWAKVKVGWRAQSVGWFKDSTLIGAGLVLFRPIPRLPQRSLAYLPEGPAIDWLGERFPAYRLDDWIAPLVRYCKAAGAFQVKMGPPVAMRRWDDETVKVAIADAAEGPWPRRFGEVLATWHSSSAVRVTEYLRSHGWQQERGGGSGFGDVQPRYVFQLNMKERSLDDLFAGFNQQWRRNIRKAEKSGVKCSLGSRSDLGEFHSVYRETAQRDHFTPRGLEYFERMWDAFDLPAESPLAGRAAMTLHCARIDGRMAAATIMMRVGTHAWYTYGASTTADRDAKPSNALQWHMITTAHDAGAHLYDMRGVSESLDPEDHLLGLVKFKVGSGGYLQEYAGEWDFRTRAALAKAFEFYQRRG